MLLVVVAVALVLTVLLRPRARAGLAAIRLSAAPVLVGAVALQVGAALAARAGASGPVRVLHLGSYAALAVVVWANRRIPWLWLVALGGAANLAAIVANGGVMPASAGALRAAGLVVDGGSLSNSGPVDHARLAFLGDVFATPRWLPLANVFSVGDAVLCVGLLLVVHAAGRRAGPRRPGRSRRGRSRTDRRRAARPAQPGDEGDRPGRGAHDQPGVTIGPRGQRVDGGQDEPREAGPVHPPPELAGRWEQPR